MESNKHYLLYFGSVFLWTEVELIDVVGQSMEPPIYFKDAIKKDIEVLRKALFADIHNNSISWSITGAFHRIPEKNIWLYKHQKHVNCSAAKYENFVYICKVNSNKPAYTECVDHPHHYAFKPFFRDNITLQRYYEYKLSKLQEDDSQREYLQHRLDLVSTILEKTIAHKDRPFCSPGPLELPI